MWRHFFRHYPSWKQKLQTVALFITIFTAIIAIFIWFIDIRNRVKEIPDVKATVQKNEKAIGELFIELENLEEKIGMQERIAKLERQFLELEEKIKKLTPQKQETLSTPP